MSTHDEQYGKIPLYVQNELLGQELEKFQAHLVTCAACTAELQQERTLSALLRQCSPLYEAPGECAQRVRELLIEHHAELPTMSAVPLPAMSVTDERLPLMRRWKVLLPAAAVIVLCLLVLPNLVQQARADSYVRMAVTTYHQVLEGQLSFGIRSSSPKEVTAWISGRVPFAFRLPESSNTQQAQAAYRLAGASVLDQRGHPAALITYKKQDEKITLLVASTSDATVAGGQRIQHQDLMFHYFTVDGATVVTWSIHDLSYALVTSKSSSGQGLKPCLVCHQDMSDRRLFQLPRQH